MSYVVALQSSLYVIARAHDSIRTDGQTITLRGPDSVAPWHAGSGTRVGADDRESGLKDDAARDDANR